MQIPNFNLDEVNDSMRPFLRSEGGEEKRREDNMFLVVCSYSVTVKANKGGDDYCELRSISSFKE